MKKMDTLNEKYLPGYENESRPPLIINFFMPKYERKQFLNKIQGNETLLNPPAVLPVHRALIQADVFQF